MIHAESERGAERAVTSYKADTMVDAFNWAADQLARGCEHVRIWVSGPRNVPITVNRINYFDFRNQWATITEDD